MTYTIELDPRIDAGLQERAAIKGMRAEKYIAGLIERDIQQEKNQRTIALIQSWIDDGDEAEQRETFEAVKKGLNENHSSDRVMFP